MDSYFKDRRNKICKDILMICKGHYSSKHKTTEAALLAYYNKHYLDYVTELSYKDVINIWFIDCIFEFVRPENLNTFLNKVFNQTSLAELPLLGLNQNGARPATDFYEVLYHRLKSWMDADLQVKDKEGNWIIDLSEYTEGETILEVI